MHAPGVFFSPPGIWPATTAGTCMSSWNYPVKFHDYMHQEDDYREAMIEVGIPVEKEK